MAKAYSMELRERVMAACDGGSSAAEVAARPQPVAVRYAVSESFIEKLKRQRRERGTLAPKPHAGGRQPVLAEHDEALRALLKAKPDTTLEELREALGLPVQLSTLWYRLDYLGLTFKKTLRAAEQKREDVRLRRDEWRVEQPRLNSARLVFLEETGATTVLTRR